MTNLLRNGSKSNCIIPLTSKPEFNTLEITSEFEIKSLDYCENGLTENDTLKRRARSKFLNTALSGRLLHIDSPLKDKYRDTYYCGHVIEVNGEETKSRFCRNRWCLICNRIRTATLIQTYLPTLDSWQDKHFVTLTIPNVKAEELPTAMSGMLKSFCKIKDNERKQGNKITGVRKLEITYNRTRDDYHPHYHFILNSGERCKSVVDQWLKHQPGANNVAQDYKPADKNSCFELFKYFTKLTSNSSKDKRVNVSALDTIFQSVTGVRTFQPFGFIAHKVEPPPELKQTSSEIFDTSVYIWEKSVTDFLSADAELLTNYEPSGNDINWTKNIR